MAKLIPANKESEVCSCCKDGWPRWDLGDGTYSHELPEPAPMYKCDEAPGSVETTALKVKVENLEGIIDCLERNAAIQARLLSSYGSRALLAESTLAAIREKAAPRWPRNDREWARQFHEDEG